MLPAAVDLATDFFTESSASALRSVFSRWSLPEARAWLSDPDQIGIELALEAETNKLFPASNDAREVRDRLVSAARRCGATVVPGAALADLRPSPEGGGRWECVLEGGRAAITADRVVLATGGKSFPGMGTVGTGYDILARLGHALRPPYPALTPLLGHHPGPEPLPGLSVYTAQLEVVDDGGGGGGKKRRGPKSRAAKRTALLFTHRGFSGPAAMDLSHHFAAAADRGLPPPRLTASWVKGMDRGAWEAALAEGGSTATVTALLRRQGLPARLADALAAAAGLPPGRRLPELRKGERLALLQALSACVLDVTGTEGYPKAEVTGGGVPLSELNIATMESRVAPGVHVCGELCDVHGRIGGFNFYLAWCTGRLAGRGAAAAIISSASAGARR